MTYWVVSTASLLLGYEIGRTRPWQRLRDRAWWYATTAKPDQASKVKLFVCLAVWVDRVVAVYWKRWRRRNDPPRKLPQMREDKP